jgi:hypothetical protein
MKMKHIKQNIENNKFLANPKYHKNNYWSVAHFESWAVQGKAGGVLVVKKLVIIMLHYTINVQLMEEKINGESYRVDIVMNVW